MRSKKARKASGPIGIVAADGSVKQETRVPTSVALDEVAKARWIEITAILEEKGVDPNTALNRLKLEATCLAWSEFLRATAALREEGQSYTTKNQAGGLMIRKRPEVDVANAFLGHYQRFLKLLDVLAPSDDGDDEDPTTKYLSGKS